MCCSETTASLYHPINSVKTLNNIATTTILFINTQPIKAQNKKYQRIGKSVLLE